jgi:hypothetical protein
MTVAMDGWSEQEISNKTLMDLYAFLYTRPSELGNSLVS